MSRNVPCAALLLVMAVGPTLPDEEITIILTRGTRLTDVSLLRVEGDTLVAMANGNTISVHLNDVSEISSRSRIMGLSGCWFGWGAGAIGGAACAAASGPYETPNGGEIAPAAAVTVGACVGSSVGALTGCIMLPENERRYNLSNKLLSEKRQIVHSILARYSTQRE